MILLVAGKGHERFQIIEGQALEFSDVEVVREGQKFATAVLLSPSSNA